MSICIYVYIYVYRFVGPTEARIVLSCLPLFCLPENEDHTHKMSSPKSDDKLSHDIVTATPSTTSAKENNSLTNLNGSISDQSISSSDFMTPLPNFDSLPPVPVDTELPGDIFSLVDPFEGEEDQTGFNGIEQSTRSLAINQAFEKAGVGGGGGGGGGGGIGGGGGRGRGEIEEGGGRGERIEGGEREEGGGEDNKDGDFTDSDDNIIGDEDSNIRLNYVPDVRSMTRTASVSFVSLEQVKKRKISKGFSSSTILCPTKLPPSPLVKFPRYVERGGWLIKLSHRKGI